MKPNVLLFIDSFHQGGTEQQVVQLTRLLVESGRYNVHLACLNRDGVLRREVERLGFTDIPEFRLNSLYDHNALVQLRSFVRMLRARRIQIVETHDFYTNIFGMVGATIARTPVRIASRRESDGVRTAAQRFAARRAFNLAHVVIANSEAVRQELVAAGVRAAKVVTIYNGVDIGRLVSAVATPRDEILIALGLPADRPRRFVTVVANLRHPMKDQQTFLRAARRVREVFPEVAFVLAGEGELLPTLSAYAAEQGLADDTFFLGRCARVGDLLAVSDVCALSSRCGEGFSNAISEYMAAARPVVATDVGGAREAIVEGETGYIVPVGDDEAMAARIIDLLGDSERARVMGVAGRRVVEEKFSCAVLCARMESLYEQLLSDAGGAGCKAVAPDSCEDSVAVAEMKRNS
jgi:glycosyltransferase involved in cell wall biosynthesis